MPRSLPSLSVSDALRSRFCAQRAWRPSPPKGSAIITRRIMPSACSWPIVGRGRYENLGGVRLAPLDMAGDVDLRVYGLAIHAKFVRIRLGAPARQGPQHRRDPCGINLTEGDTFRQLEDRAGTRGHDSGGDIGRGAEPAELKWWMVFPAVDASQKRLVDRRQIVEGAFCWCTPLLLPRSMASPRPPALSRQGGRQPHRPQSGHCPPPGRCPNPAPANDGPRGKAIRHALPMRDHGSHQAATGSAACRRHPGGVGGPPSPSIVLGGRICRWRRRRCWARRIGTEIRASPAGAMMAGGLQRSNQRNAWATVL